MRQAMLVLGAVLAATGCSAVARTGSSRTRTPQGEREAAVFSHLGRAPAEFISGCTSSSGVGNCVDGRDARGIRPRGRGLVVQSHTSIGFVLGARATRLEASVLYASGRQRILGDVRGRGRSWQERLPANLGHPTKLVLFARYGSDDATFLVRLIVRPTHANPARACPRSNRHFGTSPIRSSPERLVPGRPVRLLLCRYAGLEPHPKQAGRLRAARLLSRTNTVPRLAREFNRLRPAPTGPIACPADTAEEIAAYFGYRRAMTSRVIVRTSGCRIFTNGRVSRSGDVGVGPMLLRRLVALTK